MQSDAIKYCTALEVVTVYVATFGIVTVLLEYLL